jgi:predicted metal-dependent peptidase
MKSEALDQITVAVDCSGSISSADMDAFMSEITYIWDMLKPKKLRLLAFDTRIQDDFEFNEGDCLDTPGLHGGGGTHVEPVLKTVQDDCPEITIIFTDGYFAVPPLLSEINSDIFWIIKNNSSDFSLPIGTVINYD